MFSEPKVIEKYLESEIRLIDPDKSKPISIALAYPDIYENGLPNLAIQVLYREINKRIDTYATRVYVPDSATKEWLKKTGMPYFTWEDRKPLKEHDIVAFSISFEGLHSYVLEILDLSKIPFFSHERNEDYPLIIAGGPTPSYNPEPIANFMDAIVVGESEEIIHEIIEVYKNFKHTSKQEILSQLAKIPGIYVPSFYEINYDDKGSVNSFKTLHPNAPLKIKKRIFSRLKENPARSVFITPNTIYKEATFSLEFERGCLYSCPFCQYGINLKPPKWLSIEKAIDIILKEGISHTKIMKIFYEGLPPKYLNKLFRALEFIIDHHKITLRVGAFVENQVTENIIRIIAKTDQRIITVAPETAEGFLRDTLGKKRFTDEILLHVVEMACKYGIPDFGLYLMMGLVGEGINDIKNMGRLILKVREAMDNNGNLDGLLEVHITPFFPKPLTTFQWAPVESIKSLLWKLNLLRKIISEKYKVLVDTVSKSIVGTGYLEQKERNSDYQIIIKTIIGTKIHFIQPILSRGDRRAGKVLLDAYLKGNTLDSWRNAMANANLSPELYFREKSINEVLPWFFLDNNINEKLRIRQWEEIKEALKKRDFVCYQKYKSEGNRL